jgi:hypothetical protein
MTEITDPTFYRTPADAIAAAPESLACVAAFDPRGEARDALAVLDRDGASAAPAQAHLTDPPHDGLMAYFDQPQYFTDVAPVLGVSIGGGLGDGE